ncbi:N-acetyltransferase [Paenibacillus gallinarum]|uniref:N-acetyltransferase n=1 Tax=Paenibacillus gallinarum TaxID=2762232 RepID=A0ABR8SY07_9BACL|nr:N-acetyltransferase [Paenibacillus gallinarum]MBD7968388.1 N-acetyltransferase [Paenibacillus gallinarum]
MKLDILDYIDDFSLVELTNGYRLEDFECTIEEYKIFLTNRALSHQELNISRTYLLISKSNSDVVAYMSLISDSIKLKQDEKISYFDDSAYFPSYPSMKIAKLAVDKNYSTNYKNIGTLMIELSKGIAAEVNESIACRFITVDADVEHHTWVTNFYEKCGFVPNEGYKPKSTISMRLNIFPDSVEVEEEREEIS